MVKSKIQICTNQKEYAGKLPAIAVCGPFGRDAYNNMIKDNKYSDNKELLTVEGATHCDLYDQKDIIPFDKIEEFIRKNIK